MRFNLSAPSSSDMPCIIPPIPGIIPAIFERGPIFMIFVICSFMSRMVNMPSARCFCVSFICAESFVIICTCSIRPDMSPYPSNFEIKGFGAKRSISAMCSPVPRNMMGVCVAATAEMAPPPAAPPSVLVMMIAPKSAVALKAADCDSAA